MSIRARSITAGFLRYFCSAWLGIATSRPYRTRHELYRDPKRAGQTTYETFESYWIAKMGKPFSAWVELEKVHHFAVTACPALLDGTFEEARKAHLDAAPEQASVGAPNGSSNNQAGRPSLLAKKESKEDLIIDASIIRSSSNSSIISPDTPNTSDGSIVESTIAATKPKPKHDSHYYLGRLKKERPDIAESWVRGEYQSVRSAAIAAGMIKPPRAENQVATWAAKSTDLGAVADKLLEKVPPDRLIERLPPSQPDRTVLDVKRNVSTYS